MKNNINRDNIFAIASYIISLNKDFFLSDKKINIGNTRNGTNLGRLWLNKYLHIISARYSISNNKEIDTNGRQWRAQANGGVIIGETEAMLKLSEVDVLKDKLLTNKMKNFVDEVLDDLSNSDIKRLIKIAHKDKNWEKAWENSKSKSNESDAITDEFNFSRY